MPRIILIDGNSLMYRAYYGTAHVNLMQNKKGDYTNAIFAFSNMLQAVMSQRFDNILIAFDKGKKTFRHEFMDEYKGGRSPMPEELRSQIPNLKKMITYMGVKQYELDLYEADDIIGTMAKKAVSAGYVVDIYSSDKDMLQLVNDSVTVHLTKKGMTDLEDFDPKHIEEKYTLTYKQMIDFKALMGDPSDNLKGIEGVGEKTAIKLLNEYQTLDGILEHSTEIKGKLGERIVSSKDNALLCRKMVTINCDSPIEITLDDTKYEGITEELVDFYKEMEFHSFLKRMESNASKPRKVDYEEFSFKVINDDESLNKVLDKENALYIEINNDNYERGDIIGIGLSNANGTFVLPYEFIVESKVFEDFLLGDSQKSVFDAKRTIIGLNKIGYKINGITFDALLGAYLANPLIGKEEFKVIASEYVENDLLYDENIYGKSYKNILEFKEYAFHIAKKAYYLKKIEERILAVLDENKQLDLFKNIEMPLAFVLADMEIAGMCVDMKELNRQRDDLSRKILDTEDNIFELVGKEFNIASPKQLGEILFEYLKLPVVKKTKTGYSTDNDVLERLINEHPVIEQIISYRRLTKLYSTYIEGISSVVFSDSKVHTIFKQALTTTGRLSSVEPNLQNIPIRTEEGKEIRKMFVPEADVFLSADYSQIELRVLAHMASEKALIEAFHNDEDIHERTAKLIFNKDQITKDERRKAKAVNFGVIYGMSAWGLSEDIHIMPKDAKIFIEKYFEKFPGIKVFMDKTVAFAIEKGYVLTIMNRRRYIPEIQSNVYMQREFGKRTAMNAPIQGSAADIIKVAMIKIAQEFRDKGLKSKMVLQVHDELIFDCLASELEMVKDIVKNTMENALKLLVPLKIEYDFGNNWFEVK